ncbi:partial Putative HTH-type transcriptional regulator, partial [Thermoflexales bacterium]
MSHLEIHLLGPFQVTLGRVPVTNFGADTARALLAYLVWHAGVPLPRETLAELLWPEQPADKALHALSQTLNRLRKALGEATAASPFLNLTRDTIEFNAQADYDLDVTAFTRLIAACQQHSHRDPEVCGSCQARREQAAALYRVDLLSGFFLNSRAFEEWLVLQRELLQRQAIETFYALAAYHERHGRYERAYHYAWRQIELEPWREAAQRQLMRSSALNGQRGTALMQYQRCCQILADELGVAPERETTALYEQIQAEQLEPGTVLTHNLPASLTTFVGRQMELAHIRERINQPHDRLVTLVGPGGIGKTRLAVQAAQNEVGNFRDGVCFVSLAAVAASEFATSLAQALSFTFTGNQSPWLELFDYLREKDLLLVLDSFEHLLSEVEQIAELLRHAPHVRLLVSSRERLNIHGEWVMPLAGLPYPQDGGNEPLAEEAGEWAAMQLFEQSARRIRSDRPLDRSDAPAIKRICQFVDGLPLGLELAAVWSRVLACHEIATEIQRNVDFLQTSLHDVPERHRSLRAVFDHSWALLSSEEQLVFSRQAVFQGSFDRTATLAVTGASSAVLATLIDKSLLEPVTPMPGQGSHEASSQRYQLHSLLQHYAAERLAAAPAVEAETRDRHGRYYLAFLQRCLPDLKGSALRRALEAIGLEINNVRAAWKWAVAHKRSEELAPALEGLYLFYEAQGWFQEGEESFRRVVQALQDDHRSLGQIIVGRALACRGWFTFRQGRYAEARQLLEQSLTLLREQAALPAVAFTLNRLGEMAFLSGKYAEAQASCQESRRLCQTADDSDGLVTALVTLGRTACAQGNYAEAQHDS